MAYDYFAKKGNIDNLATVDRDSNTALHHTIAWEKTDRFKIMVSSVVQHIDPNRANKNKDTITCSCASQGEV